MSEPGKSRLTLYIFLGIVLAVGLALIKPEFAMRFEFGGEIFLRLLKMMVVPLVMASVMSGIIGLGDVRKLGRPGAAAVGYYAATTVLAVMVGLVMVNVIRPGVDSISADQLAQAAKSEDAARIAVEVRDAIAKSTGLSPDKVAEAFEELPPPGDDKATMGRILKGLALMLFTDNLFQAAAETNLLPLIVFAVIFAGMLTTMGSRVRAITQMIEQVNDALLSFVMLLMKIAPLGIFCLVTARFGKAQAAGGLGDELTSVGWYMVAVLTGLSVHAFITLPLILWFFTRRNPYQFMYQMGQALLTAFSTASSSATLPVTMDCAAANAGVKRESVEFVLPLGATINMDGTALYEAVAAIFIAQAVGFELTFAHQVTIALTATLAAIGAAGIPEAGLFTMLIVLNAVGLPVEYIGLILSVDWLLDRFRTTVNVLGDSMGAAVVEGTFAQVESGDQSA
jgi:Na+/H+-dicarboxylate symporter